MEQALISAGLTKQQARAYIYIINHSPASPAAVAAHLKLTRTNAYKLAGKLAELGLIVRSNDQKKIAYSPSDPVALANLLAEARNKMIALEKATKQAIKIIRNQSIDNKVEANVYKGRAAIVELFKEQAERDATINSIHSRADIPVMGFITMNQIRHFSTGKRAWRHGLTPDAPGGVINPALDKHTNLLRTWLPHDAYTAPVEWSSSGNQLNLFIYADEPYAIRITDSNVADAFRQIWRNLDTYVRESKEYKKLPRYANRKV